MKQYTAEESGAFREMFTVEPSRPGVLSGLTFAVKDLIDIAGHITGCGNPAWHATHPPAAAHALCVEQLLAAGAQCKGKTVTDELAFSLIGENHFYGTPLNPRAPERVCGGSSSGSASAVACGLVDFALGTDTGGSVRVPSANCGLWGMRPSHGIVSVAGVNPLAPTFDTVGILASTYRILREGMSVLLSRPVLPGAAAERIYLLDEPLAICDPDVHTALQSSVQRLKDAFGNQLLKMSIRSIDGETGCSDLLNWFDVYRVLQRAEAWSCLGSWVEAANPEFGQVIAESLELSRTQDRSLIPPMALRREHYAQRMMSFLGPRDLLCIPTAPSPAPLKGTIRKREQAASGYYPRALSNTAIAGTARLPQVTIPVTTASGSPIGISFLARSGEDAFLLSAIETISSLLIRS